MGERNTLDTLYDFYTKLMHRNGRLQSDSIAAVEQEPGWSWSLTENEERISLQAMKITIEIARAHFSGLAF